MTEKELKYKVGMFLVLANLIVILTIATLRFMWGVDGEQFTTLLAVTIPMFSGYSTSIIAFIVSDRYELTDNTKVVSFAFSILSFAFPITFVTLILVATILQANSLVFSNFEDFKSFLLAIESTFATYIGYFIYSMFKPVKSIRTKFHK